MGTGSGKTMVALIPFFLEKDLATIIVLPLKSLITDYKRKLDSMQIEYEHYGGSTRRLSGDQRLILLSTDVARQKHWKEALAYFHTTYYTVACLIFDEDYYILTSSNFHDSLRDVYEESAIRTAFSLMDSTIVICTPTQRPEL